MNKLIILRGNSGSGKSTIAKSLQKHFGHETMMLSQDNISRDMIYTEEDQEAEPLMMYLLEYAHKNCEIAIMDGIYKKSKYEKLLHLANDLYGHHIHAYYFDLPFEETLKRHQTRWKVKEFGADEMKRWWNDRDFIGFISEKIITKELSKEEIVKLIVRDIERD